MTTTRERLDGLSPQEQRALLAQLIHEKGPQPKRAPLSFTQERIWFLDQLDPGTSAFNMTVAVRLTGRLYVAALEQSFNEIVRRHETLRATFVSQDGRPVQVIHPAWEIRLPVVDLCQFPEAEREVQARRLIGKEAQCPFDLARGPLLRVKLLKLGKEIYIILINNHHIVSDGWSQAVLLRELTTLYRAFVEGRVSPLAELPIQYADFSRWQRMSQQAGVLEQDLAYWKKQLAGPLPVLELVADRLHVTTTAQVVRRTTAFSQPLTRALKALSRQQGTTLFMTLLAAFKTLLWRYTGQTDVVVGSPIANRDRAELESLIGPFINTLVLRTDLSGNPTFLELLGRVRRVVLQAFEHTSLPFEQLVDVLQPERDLNRNPLFQVVFILQDLPKVSLELGDLCLDPFPIDFKVVEAPDLLGISIQETEEGLDVVLERRADLLNQGTLAHLEALLEDVVADPQRRLSELTILSDQEQRRLLAEWNDTRRVFPRDQCFPQLFETQVERTPDAVAAVCGDDHLTYRRLNRRANRLARVLIGRGVGPDTVVVLLAERGLGFLSAILGTFKAGGAYLPLDPHYPAQRLRLVLEGSRAPLILVADEFAPALADALAGLSSQEQPVVLRLSQLPGEAHPADDLAARCTPRNLAYVIYTSGSTGVPKGAMLEQRGMVNHLCAKIKDLALTDADVVAQNASQSFDISVWQFLTSLLVGGRVEIFTDEISHDPARLLAHVSQRGVTVLEIVPSLLRTMLEQVVGSDPDRFSLASLRWLMPTGEALPPDLAHAWLDAYPNCPLINAYGPAECSDDVTHGFIRQLPATDLVRVPIGRPIANSRFYVLDPQLQPVPVGVAGELYVGGVGVGRGYLHEPRKTAGAFIPDPFAPPALQAFPPLGGTEGGARLYKTGDLVCYRTDGRLEFLGRVDHQVKVRGFRIELGEIEVVLRGQPSVRDAVVIARDDQTMPGVKQLVAYVVARSEGAPTADDLRNLLRGQLPDYMVPSAFVLLDAMPLTPNGKVNRKALPAPDLSQLGCAEEFVPPEGPLETRLAEIWSEVLGIEKIGVFDNFFNLGGHSLLATQVLYHINQTFQMDLALRGIFEEPTVAGLALLIEESLIDELESLEA